MLLRSADAPPIADLLPGFRAETELERDLTGDPDVRAGLAWGSPRWGHPEGLVAHHVAAMLERIAPADPQRSALRAIAVVHDAAKRAVVADRGWSPANDHAALARAIAARHTDDERLLSTIELHDEPYWQWRHDAPDASAGLLLRRTPDPQLFARFVELDGSTDGKDLSFLWWFRRQTLDVLTDRTRDWSRAPILPGPAIEFLYAKSLAIAPGLREPVAAALQDVVARGRDVLQAAGQVLTSDDGLRALLVWRFSTDATARVLRDGTVVREALRRHDVLRQARGVEARLYRSASGDFPPALR
jgi:hypothetical protein